LVKFLSIGKNLYIFLAKLIFLLGKIFISWQNLYLFLVQLLYLNKTYISSWLNAYLLAKFISPSTILLPFFVIKHFNILFFKNSSN